VRPFLVQSNDEDLRRAIVQLAHRGQEIRLAYVLDADQGLVAHSDERRNPAEGHPPLNDASWKRVVGEWRARSARPDDSALLASLPYEEGGARLALFALPIFPAGASEVVGGALNRDLPAAQRPHGYVVLAYSLASLDKALSDLEVEKQKALRLSGARSALLGLFCALVGLVIAILQGVRISQPIQALSFRVQQLAAGDFSGRVEVESKDEIGLLASNFNHMAIQLEELVQNSADKVRLENEVTVARSMQQLLVPQANALQHERVQLSAYYSAAAECGGDWWTFHDLEDGRTLLVIADVTGQGVPAAVLTASAKAACDVARRLATSALDCAHVLDCINFAIHEACHGELLMTAVAAILDHPRRQMTYANAGHCLPMMFRQKRGELGELSVGNGPGAPLGVSASLTCPTGTIDVDSGDLLVLYTDGLVESLSPSRQMFGKRRLRELMVRSAHMRPWEVRDAIVTSMLEFSGGAVLKDDVTIVVARIV
jgi:serine phosphatase RsbU (regulator of sigma subunit)